MLMRVLLFLFVLALAGPAWAVCGPDAPPAAALARGYTCETFWDDFTAVTSTVDVNDTLAPGFKWYPHNRWPCCAAGHTGFQTVASTPAGDFAQDVGGLKLTPSVNTLGLNMTSCATNGIVGGYVGSVLPPGGRYIKMVITSGTPGTLMGNNWWPVFWAMPVEFFAAADPFPGVVTYGELDIWEANSSTEHPTIHWWTAAGNTMNDHATSYDGGSSTLTSTTFGTMVVPAVENAGVGFVYRDVNGTHQGPDVLWPPGDANYDLNATQHTCLIITTGMSQPLIIRSVQVFQAPPGGSGGRFLFRK